MSAPESRKSRLMAEELMGTRTQTDRIFVALMLLQWVCGIILALVVSPYSWEGSTRSVHFHVSVAVILGGLISSLPVALALFAPGTCLTRLVLAVGQMLWSGLLIHLTGGRIETHFHVFGSLALLAFYLDWKVLTLASAVTALDHVVRGMIFPESIYGLTDPEWWRSCEHAAWVVFEDIFLLISIRTSLRQIENGVDGRVRVEDQVQRTEELVQLRTQELRLASEQLAERNRTLEQNAEALLQASRAKSEFLANMSHEIRTPMTAILGYTDLLADGHADDRTKSLEAVNTIRRNGTHLLTIINDILDLSKIEAGRVELEQIEFSLQDLVSNVVDLMKVQAEAKALKLSLQLAPHLPRTLVGDPTRVRQVLMNLVGNAIKFTERGSVVVQVTCREREAGLRVELRVQDTGLGMASEQSSKAFEAFSQADNSMTRRFGGTGLGLAISRRLVEIMQGTIRVETALGQGSTFIVNFPTRRGATVTAPASIAAHKPAVAASDNDLFRGARILIVEDGPDNQQLLSFMLKKLGATVTLTANGQEGVDAVMSCDPPGSDFDVVLMDMQMPVLDGYSATGRLREFGIKLPIIAVTAHALESDRSRCLDAGCSDYITKPLKKDELRRALTLALCDSHSSEQSSANERSLANSV